MKKLIISFIMIFFCGSAAVCGDYAFLFKKELIENDIVEKLSGDFYLLESDGKREDKVFFEIKKPVHQIITFEKDETKVFYPEENKLFIIPSDKNLGNNALGLSVKKIDPAAMGFIFVKKISSDSGVIFKWVPKDIIRSGIKNLEIKYDSDDNLTEVAMYGLARAILMRVTYGNYLKIGNKKFPLFVEVYSKISGESYLERMVYKLKKTEKVPEYVKYFVVPKDSIVIRGKL
ncbi:MAG TPA: hypothetical protein PLB12_00815 [Candidatus Goldiibacteriota bacterium]|nr:hypothetical protein [Candidatus Goldiibacteriota bacterium]HPN65295.1 hypothetical protein [Candidatus Goldiibacteriota bacterium]HRQ42874.1 hypothetical protein [Candidatus Goldiibacteriota bacterium]